MPVYHGNAGAAYHRDFYMDALQRLGWRVIPAEYPGYGGRPGRHSEPSLVADARETLGIAHRQCGSPLYLWGESLGSGVAAGVARQALVPIAGVVMMLPWESLAAVARSHYWYLPTRWLARDRFDSADNLRHFSGPVAVLLAGRDEIVLVALGEALYAALNTRKRRWLFERASHNAMPLAPTLPWWGEVVGFMEGREAVAVPTSLPP